MFLTDDEDAFVASFLGGLGSFPPYFLRTRAINQRGADVGAHERSLAALDPDRVEQLLEDGAALVDVRRFDAFSAGHIAGSISIELRPQFATWLGWVVPGDVPVAFVLDDDQDQQDVIVQSLKIGYDNIVGELRGGTSNWTASGRELTTYDLRQPGDRSGALVDVRQASELSTGMIPGALHADAGSIASHALPFGPLTLHCGHGQRATTAASLLERAGVRATDLGVLVGGPQDWSAVTGQALQRSA